MSSLLPEAPTFPSLFGVKTKSGTMTFGHYINQVNGQKLEAFLDHLLMELPFQRNGECCVWAAMMPHEHTAMSS